MSLAFSTLVLVLFAVIPGAVLERTVYSGKLYGNRPPSSTLADLGLFLAFSLPVHLTTLWVVALATDATIDYQGFSRILTGEFGDNGEGLNILAATLSENRGEVLLYFLTALLVAVALGQTFQYLVLSFPSVARLIPVRNRWFVPFFSPGDRKVSGCIVYVLAKSQAGQSSLLYRGDLADFWVDSNGRLDEILLGNPSRGHLEKPEGDAGADAISWHSLKQESLILGQHEIANLSFSRIEIWRPLFIVGQRELSLPAPGASVEVEFSWITKLLPPNRFYVRGVDDSAHLSIEQVGRSRVKITAKTKGSLAQTHARITAVRSYSIDARAELVGNLLYSLHQFALKKISDLVERRLKGDGL